ncbi:serine/threonine protein kinase [Herbihabitans rhizosphaerae]|uniref:non-specific serine/threonine protein kinase n=1 Tax=Herbihabitans rhizosphaerae TaxID=1872711 RepID=A0A4Q7KV03_9PSEU|nr:serine/threonine-protein kinase [Herbihabitans rhizosphaerae]RZS40839.1 serine/threonine protein kinase [Herbihabitans rhizosphaerae]
MDGLVQLAASVLSLAHDIFGPDICPGDWVWATMMSGVILALFPMFGAIVIAIVRKGTGNRYNGGVLITIGVIGGILVFLLPWLFASGISEVFHAAFRRPTPDATGLSSVELASLRTGTCWVGEQRVYLGGKSTVYEALIYSSGNALDYIARLVFLVVVPLLCLLFVWLQIRAALRRGPKWPGRLFWLPFVALWLFSAPLGANVATFLWLGFLPASVLGMIPVLLVGPPRWSVIGRSEQRPEPPFVPAQQPPPYQPPPYRPPTQAPAPPPYQPPPPSPPPGPPRQELAAAPGPLPFGDNERTTSMWHNTGRFRKVRALGHGGFGTVWLARDTQLDRTVAVKMAHAPDAEAEERMYREARALAAVHHPNCVRVYDIVEDTDGLGLVMEYIEGQALADAVHDRGALDDVASARLWMTMAGALSAAHAKGVLHRDVKPANVIVDPRGAPHLIDFGIARSRGDSTLTSAGMMVGTPDFLAPETAAGRQATPASDAWQLAATVSYALTGHPPRGVRDNAMASLLAASRAEPVSMLPKRSAHRRLLLAALDAEPARRPTLGTVSRAMSDWLADSGHAEEGPVTKIAPRPDPDRTRPSHG